jgi:hypothetical protein
LLEKIEKLELGSSELNMMRICLTAMVAKAVKATDATKRAVYESEVNTDARALQSAIDSLIELPQSRPPTDLPEKQVIDLNEWVKNAEGNDRDMAFAQYCASCAVVDERVLDMQLSGCNVADLGAMIRCIFKHNDDILLLLWDQPAARSDECTD